VLDLLVVRAVYARSKFAAEKIRRCGVRVCVGNRARLSSIAAFERPSSTTERSGCCHRRSSKRCSVWLCTVRANSRCQSCLAVAQRVVAYHECSMMRKACNCGVCVLSAITTPPTNMTTQLFCKDLRHAYNFCVSAS
jgi:hypothetical protein